MLSALPRAFKPLQEPVFPRGRDSNAQIIVLSGFACWEPLLLRRKWLERRSSMPPEKAFIGFTAVPVEWKSPLPMSPSLMAGINRRKICQTRVFPLSIITNHTTTQHHCRDSSPRMNPVSATPRAVNPKCDRNRDIQQIHVVYLLR